MLYFDNYYIDKNILIFYFRSLKFSVIYQLMAIQSSEVVLDTKQMSLEKLKVRLH